MIYKTPKDRRGNPLCHLCKENIGTQMHELIGRYQTVALTAARNMSFCATLTALLCPLCHAEAEIQSNEELLWANNFKLWGKDKVLADLALLEDLCTVKPIYHLPEDNYGN